jgi:hypothetical protein
MRVKMNFMTTTTLVIVVIVAVIAVFWVLFSFATKS